MSIWIMVEGCGTNDDGVPHPPWVNLANGNAVRVFAMLGLQVQGDGDWHGVIETSELPGMIRRCIQVMNVQLRRNPFLREAVDEKPEGRARLISPAVDHDYLIDRARRMLEVFKAAQEKGARVIWG